jgi:hypothetical protein
MKREYFGNLLLVGFAVGGIVAAFGVARFFRSEEENVRSQAPIIFCQPQDAPPEQQQCFFASHIDVYVTLKIWGEEKTLPFEQGDLTKSHLHAQKNKVHWHSLIPVDPRKKLLENHGPLTLGQLFEDLGIPFDRDRILGVKNGDVGPSGKPGVLKMFVNGQPNDQFRDYVRQPNDHIDFIVDET